jgi:3-mercaptopyruvate sulfurtransferase SseA
MAAHDLPIVSAAEVARLLSDLHASVWLVHAASAVPFGDGHIPGALAARDPAVLAALADDALVVVYGGHDGDAAASGLARSLRASGVEAAWFRGGLAAWSRAGHPVERSG